eukprot:gb/GECG01001219.1/.p1 GENE.gb/GECG01001219.1/~~gb/GECG01001219.1/.p1  ORF type:complete len:529 (+),score=61.90 gb/GECG01001219.1/:1-1587(+)
METRDEQSVFDKRHEEDVKPASEVPEPDWYNGWPSQEGEDSLGKGLDSEPWFNENTSSLLRSSLDPSENNELSTRLSPQSVENDPVASPPPPWQPRTTGKRKRAPEQEPLGNMHPLTPVVGVSMPKLGQEDLLGHANPPGDSEPSSCADPDPTQFDYQPEVIVEENPHVYEQGNRKKTRCSQWEASSSIFDIRSMPQQIAQQKKNAHGQVNGAEPLMVTVPLPPTESLSALQEEGDLEDVVQGLQVKVFTVENKRVCTFSFDRALLEPSDPTFEIRSLNLKESTLDLALDRRTLPLSWCHGDFPVFMKIQVPRIEFQASSSAFYVVSKGEDKHVLDKPLPDQPLCYNCNEYKRDPRGTLQIDPVPNCIFQHTCHTGKSARLQIGVDISEETERRLGELSPQERLRNVQLFIETVSGHCVHSYNWKKRRVEHVCPPIRDLELKEGKLYVYITRKAGEDTPRKLPLSNSHGHSPFLLGIFIECSTEIALSNPFVTLCGNNTSKCDQFLGREEHGLKSLGKFLRKGAPALK